jgi:prevent-host-death family protein
MSSDISYTATEFKAKCLEVFDRLASHELSRVTITKHGKPVAILTPPEAPAEAINLLHGYMRGSVILPDGLDLTAPAFDEELSADHGLLHL